MAPPSSPEAAVAAAERWLGTPYHPGAGLLGVGVDCALLLLRVYQEAGVVPPDVRDPDPYPPDWHLHRDEERLLAWVERYADRIDGEPAPGDVALFKVARCVAHGGVYVGAGLMIHADLGAGRVERCEVRRWQPRPDDRTLDLTPRLVGYWRPRA